MPLRRNLRGCQEVSVARWGGDWRSRALPSGYFLKCRNGFRGVLSAFLVQSRRRDYLLVLSCSSIVLSLFSMRVSLSSISLRILPSSSSRGPMYCPGLSGVGRGPMGRGRRGSGRLEGSIGGPIDLIAYTVFRFFISRDYTFWSLNSRSGSSSEQIR